MFILNILIFYIVFGRNLNTVFEKSWIFRLESKKNVVLSYIRCIRLTYRCIVRVLCMQCKLRRHRVNARSGLTLSC